MKVRVVKPAGPEQYRRRMRIESNVWLMLAIVYFSRPWLQTLFPGTCSKFIDGRHFLPALEHCSGLRTPDAQEGSNAVQDVVKVAEHRELSAWTRHHKPRWLQSATLLFFVFHWYCSSCSTGSPLRTVPHIVSASMVSWHAKKTSTAGYLIQGFLVLCLSSSGTLLDCIARGSPCRLLATRVRLTRICARSQSALRRPLSTGCCGTGPYRLSGPVALGPGVLALVSGQSGSPLYLPGQCA